LSQGLPRDSATCILEQLNVQRWIDFQTKTVEVSFILYNGNIDVYTKTRIVFTQFEGGRIQKNLFMDSIKIRDNYSTGWDFARLVLEIAFVLGCLYFNSTIYRRVREVGFVKYVQSGGWLNIFGQMLYVVNMVMWVMISIENTKFLPPDFQTFLIATAKQKEFEMTFDFVLLLNSL
jgi:hypothetical protein